MGRSQLLAMGAVVLAALIAPTQLLAQDQITGPTGPTGPEAPYPAAQDQARIEQGTEARAAKAVTIADFSFTPASITINAGDTVTWTNNGPTGHSATADDKSFDTGVFPAGQSRSHTFNQAGSFSYICTPHPNMKGTVIVEAAASTGGNSNRSSGGSTSTTPATTESAATAAPDAAGSAAQLPATGSDPLGLGIAGALLLLAGLLARRPADS